jgi:hypothetical protein
MFNLFARKCDICKKQGKDRYWIDGKKKNLCRLHLIQEFKKDFVSSTKRLVVFYPDLEEKNGCYFYRLSTLKDIDRFYSRKDNPQYGMIDFVQKNFNKINGKCKKCGYTADIAYFDKSSFKWFSESFLEYVNIHDIQKEPEILCKKCVIDKITYSIEKYKKNFDEPIILLLDEEGIVISDCV